MPILIISFYFSFLIVFYWNHQSLVMSLLFSQFHLKLLSSTYFTVLPLLTVFLILLIFLFLLMVKLRFEWSLIFCVIVSERNLHRIYVFNDLILVFCDFHRQLFFNSQVYLIMPVLFPILLQTVYKRGNLSFLWLITVFSQDL